MKLVRFTESDAVAFLEKVTVGMRAVEETGLQLPRWLTSFAGAILEAARTRAVPPEVLLYQVLVFRMSFECLSSPLRAAIERAGERSAGGKHVPWIAQVPDTLPEDLDGEDDGEDDDSEKD